MGIYNKIIINDEVMIDLSNDTVIEDKLIEGVTAHNAEGLQITGNLKKYNGEYEGDVEVLKATMYSYNGTVLPALPEWDKETYPYCAIGMWGTLYCCSTTDGTDSLKAPFLKFKFIDVGETFVHPDKSHWGECETIETDDNISILLWSNYEIYNPNGTIAITASKPVPVYLPTTLFDGEITFSLESWQDPFDYRSAAASIGISCGFNVGDTLEITFNGHTETYTARKVDTCNGIIVGNNGLNGNDVEGVDDGGDILLAFPSFGASQWSAALYTRILGTHKVKIRLLEVK